MDLEMKAASFKELTCSCSIFHDAGGDSAQLQHIARSRRDVADWMAGHTCWRHEGDAGMGRYYGCSAE